MSETTTTLAVGGMTCGGCANNVQRALEGVAGVSSAAVDHVEGSANIAHSGIDRGELEAAVSRAGYSVGETAGASGLQQLGSPPTSTATSAAGFHWGDRATWWQSANNTKWCLIGCSIGEFGTLAYYSFSGITADLVLYSNMWYFFAILPLINGLATSVMLETILLMQGQMDFSNALSTAMGMSFISMLMMEIAMEITDLLFTSGELGLMYIAIPFMLIVGFLTPWPYNYWRLKKYGQACH
jgi:copper chaperone CopZ